MRKIAAKTLPLKIYLSYSFGFTLIELLVALVIGGLLVGGGVAAYNNFNQTQLLNQAASDLRTNLRDAQNRALSGEKPSACGVSPLDGYRVTFTATSYSIQAWCGGALQGTAKVINLSGVTISSLPSPNPIMFKTLGQGTNISNSTIVTLNNSLTSQNIMVTATGEVQ